MKIWWCEVHNCGNLPNAVTKDWASVPGQNSLCLFAEEFGGVDCRMREMHLVPPEAMKSPQWNVTNPAYDEMGQWATVKP